MSGRGTALLAALLLWSLPAAAGNADVVAVQVRRAAQGVFDFDVTVRSRDTGWNAYADLLEVLGPDGTVLGRRVLEHPHDDEQPFTRDVYGVRIPAGLATVRVRARFKPTGFGGEEKAVTLP
jgi:hypothetical protein